MRPTRRFSLKLVLTAITIGVGYKGGEIVPVLFIGATFGAAYGGFFRSGAVLCGRSRHDGCVLRRDKFAAHIHPVGV